MIDRQKNIEFGILLALVLEIVSIYCHIQTTACVVAILLVTLLTPQLYTPLTWLWFRLGECLSRVVTHSILFLLFFTVVTPISLFRRWTGKDPFRLRQFKKSTESVFSAQEKRFQDQDVKKQY